MSCNQPEGSSLSAVRKIRWLGWERGLISSMLLCFIQSKMPGRWESPALRSDLLGYSQEILSAQNQPPGLSLSEDNRSFFLFLLFWLRTSTDAFNNHRRGHVNSSSAKPEASSIEEALGRCFFFSPGENSLNKYWLFSWQTNAKVMWIIHSNIKGESEGTACETFQWHTSATTSNISKDPVYAHQAWQEYRQLGIST